MKNDVIYFFYFSWLLTASTFSPVCGTVINVRQKGDKLAIWTRNAEDQANNMIIGKGLRENLGLPHQMQLGFQVHKDTITKYGSITRNKYIA